MDPFFETMLIGVPTLIVCAVIGGMLMPGIDHALSRLSDWMEDRKDRRAAR